MGDSPRPANWILEKSIDGKTFEPWVFFAETAEACRRLYQPQISYNMKITSDPRPNSLRNDEVYCTTYFSQPQNLEAGEIIVTLTMDREGASQSYYEMTTPIDPELIEMTAGINCEDCLPGYYRPLNVGPDAKDPCVPCDCTLHGSTGTCVSNDALMPEKVSPPR
ncbi:unnamed protein product [Schistocephalus solidus]|uniref:Laminin N-terminal domain-containing protein n=1 Tax=Schistocephalus solidus TaxID=70667 RepID=A0A183T0I9_SCHSO|nr:unnamed protein product [Schistocephalus solidus]